MWEHPFLILLMLFSICHMEINKKSTLMAFFFSKILIIIYLFKKKTIYQIIMDCAVCRFWTIL